MVKWAKEELEKLGCADVPCPVGPESTSVADNVDSFWGTFDARFEKEQDSRDVSIDAEIQRWSGLSAPCRTSNPVHVMEALKGDYPQIYRLFRKFSIFPSTQNKDERLFSMVARNTGPLCRNIKVETIEKKVVVGSAIAKHGFVFHYKNGNDSSTSSEDADSVS